jgi:hypothetical protein
VRKYTVFLLQDKNWFYPVRDKGSLLNILSYTLMNIKPFTVEVHMTPSQPQNVDNLVALCGALTLELEQDMPTGDAARLMTKEHAATLAQLIANDLDQALGGIRQLGLIVPGAIYDQTEVIRSTFPLFSTLQEVYVEACCKEQFSANIISLGTSDGTFPLEALLPNQDISPAPLALIPFALVGPENEIEALREGFDETLLKHGAVSEATLTCIQNAFPCSSVNASYISLAGLCALLQTHLSAIGCDTLWDILEGALFRPEVPTFTKMENGNAFLYSANSVYVPFLTYSAWAGSRTGASENERIAGYTDWIKTYRQYIAGLDAHGLIIFQFAQTQPFENETMQELLDNLKGLEPFMDHYIEEVTHTNPTQASPTQLNVVEQFDPEVGIVAYSVHSLLRGSTKLKSISPTK